MLCVEPCLHFLPTDPLFSTQRKPVGGLVLVYHNSKSSKVVFWKKCDKILKLLQSFYPSIFHNTEKMDLRVEAARFLVKNKCIPELQKYGKNMLQFAPSDRQRYISRGLPLSDLQFTSWK